MDKKTGGPAFPEIRIKQIGDPAYNKPTKIYCNWMSLRDYFIAHAPAEPTFIFDVKMETERPKPHFCMQNNLLNGLALKEWDIEFERQKYIQWPSAWADTMIEEREKVNGK